MIIKKINVREPFITQMDNISLTREKKSRLCIKEFLTIQNITFLFIFALVRTRDIDVLYKFRMRFIRLLLFQTYTFVNIIQ